MAKPRQESGMQFSPHKPHNVPERFAVSVAKSLHHSRRASLRGMRTSAFFSHWV
jgi:hypothetical protein